MARLMYRCFPAIVRELLMGCKNEDDLPKFTNLLEDEYRTHHHAVWIKVVDQASGEIAAASLWKVYPNAGTPKDGGDKVVSWLDEETRKQAEKLVGTMNVARREANPEGFVRKFDFVHDLSEPATTPTPRAPNQILKANVTILKFGVCLDLHICFTSPDYRRQGAGGLMMQWGCDLADVLSIPAWIEASVEGNALYKIYGFLDVETPPGLGEVTFMRREPKVLQRQGGHVQV